MKLTINLATRRYVNLRQLNVMLALGFTLLGGLAIFKVAEIARNASELARVRGLSQGIATRSGGTQVSEAQLKALEPRIQFANATIEKKSVNWLSLLDHLEEVVPAGVALSEIQPDHDQLLKIGGAARNFASLRALMENMERSKNFSEVYLLRQADTKVGLTQEGILFNISCKVALQ
jgi:type IV pilus assembly protein PilN